MSESFSRTPLDTRLAVGIADKIRPEWAEFETMATTPAVQQFCAFESRYVKVGKREGLKLDPELSTLRFDPAGHTFAPEQAAQALERTSQRLDAFLYGILRRYCASKKLPLPGEDDTAEIGAVLSRVFVGGIEKVLDYMEYSDADDSNERVFDYSQQLVHLPVMLLMLGARLRTGHLYEESSDDTLEPSVPLAEIDDTIDAALQESCRQIQDNQKHHVPKRGMATDADRLYAASMNVLRGLYQQGAEKGFKTALFNNYIFAFAPPKSAALEAAPFSELTKVAKKQFDDFATFFNAQLGCGFVYPGPMALNRQLQAANKLFDGFERDPERHTRHIANVLYKTYSAHSARHFVDAIAGGSIKYSEIMRAMMHLRKQPLGSYELPEPDEVQKLWVDWEMLPRGIIEPGEHGQPPDALVKPKDPRERELDWMRIRHLLGYALEWGPSASFARTSIPNLSEEKQYYAVILPQQLPDGTVIEHAIADHPQQGHGLYMWRAERGYMRELGDRNSGLTWREVLAHERMVARRLGARCLYHTKNLHYNVLDYLTAPPESLVQHRYAVGRGAVRMARLARSVEE